MQTRPVMIAAGFLLFQFPQAIAQELPQAGPTSAQTAPAPAQSLHVSENVWNPATGTARSLPSAPVQTPAPAEPAAAPAPERDTSFKVDIMQMSFY